MTPLLAITNIGQLVTLRGPNRPRTGAEMTELGLVRDAGLLVRGDTIEAVASSDEVARKAEGENLSVVDAEGGVVLPGFVDAHAHPVFAGDRLDEFEQRAAGLSYEEIARRGGGIWSTVQKTRAASEAELLEQARKHARWFLQNGTTMVEAKSGYGLSLEAEIKILRVIHALNDESATEFVPTFLGAHAVPRDGVSPEQYVEQVINEMLPIVAGEHLAEYCDIFCEAGYFDVPVARRILSAARDHGLRLRVHADQLSCSGGAQLAAELGAVTADHLEQTEAEGISALAQAKVQPVLLPGSVYSLSKTRYPKAREMISAGLGVVLATDFNPGSSPTCSMPMVQSLAVTQMRMSPAEALTASTINAACSLGRGEQVGSLEAGKLADFVLYDCEDYREISYYFGTNLVRSVYVRGTCAYQA